MRIVVAGSQGYRGIISDATYEDTDWGSSAEDFIQFNSENGELVVINLATVGSISFGKPQSPAVGDHNVWRISARGPGGGVDSLIDDDNKNAIVAALSQQGYEQGILEFTSIYGITTRLIVPNLARLLIVAESVNIPEP